MMRKFFLFLGFAPLAALVGGCAGEGDDGSNNIDESDEAIIGGQVADIRSFPWQVSLQDADGAHFCGGSVISARYVLTARHCVAAYEGFSMTDHADAPSEFRVVAGSTSNLGDEPGAQRANVADIILPSVRNLDWQTIPDDVALLRLDRDLVTSATVRPIALATSALEAAGGPVTPGRNATVSGWGVLNSDDYSTPEDLRAASIPLASNDAGLAAFETRRLASELVAAESDSGSCFGDSGGPLVVAQGTNRFLAGVVSYGLSGCSGFGVYQRVSFYQPFLSSVIGRTPVKTTLATGLSGALRSVRTFTLTVPAGRTALTIQMGGGTGDANLFARFNAAPTRQSFNCKSATSATNQEACSIVNPSAGTWHISVAGWKPYSGVHIDAQVY